MIYESHDKFENYSIELTLLRHGEDEKGKLGGWSSNHLTTTGIKQINEFVNTIHTQYDVIISSDLNRAKESAEIIAKAINVPIIYMKGFRECNNGLLINLTIEEHHQKYPDIYFSNLGFFEKYPEGESPNDFYQRVKEEFFKLLQTYDKKRILLVTHGGVISIIDSILKNTQWSNKVKNSFKNGIPLIYKIGKPF